MWPPRVINKDKNFGLAAAITELKADGVCATSVQHRRVKYVNTTIEADHGRLKRILEPKCAFKTPVTPTGRSRGWRRCTRYARVRAGSSPTGRRTRTR